VTVEGRWCYLLYRVIDSDGNLRSNFVPREGTHTRWLFFTVRNVVVDTIRRAQSRPILSPDETLHVLLETIPGPDVQALDKERAQVLWRFVARHLSPQDKEIIHLSFTGFTSKESAEILNMRPGQVRTRLHRALQKLVENSDEIS